MLKKSLKCELLEDERIHPELFKNCNRKFKFIPHKLLNTNLVNKEKTDESMSNKVKRLLENE